MEQHRALTSEEEARKIFEAARLGESAAFAGERLPTLETQPEPDIRVAPAHDDSLIRSADRDSAPTDNPRLTSDSARDEQAEPAKLKKSGRKTPDGQNSEPVVHPSLQASPRQLLDRLHAHAKVSREQGLFE